jgi:flagellar biosynthesis/type III secretory pathway M-ring protein FliF/YscJ
MLPYKNGAVLLTIAIMIGGVLATIDVNLQQFKYIADHLSVKECRKLVAALNDPNFELEINMAAAERAIPEDISCLRLLLHWNSQPGKGKGASHVTLVHRLKQLGHDELAVWLSGTVFRQLEQDLNRTLLMNPFKELGQDNATDTEQGTATPTEEEQKEEEDHWQPIDTVLLIVLLFLVFLIVFIPAPFVWRYFRKRKKRKKRKVYDEEGNGEDNSEALLSSDSQSEEDEIELPELDMGT